MSAQHRTSIKVARADILDAPSSKPTLNPDVRRKLDDIAGATLAHIAVVNSPLTLSSRTPPDGVNSTGWSGLETERVCELVITGQGDATELARVRLLVMLDELVRSAPFFTLSPSTDVFVLVERSSCRNVRDRPEAPCDHRRSQATCPPEHTGGDRD